MAVGDAEQLTVTARAHGRRIFAVLAAVLGGSGCNDPVGPDITSPSGAKLTVDVLIPGRFASDPERTAHVSAWLTPGREKNGSLREVEAPLRVSGKPIPLVAPSGSDWATTQNVIVPLTPIDGFATFAIAVPVITGVQPTIPVTSVHTMRLAEPDTVRVGGDGSLRLHPQGATPAVAGDTATTRQWVLAVTGTSSLSFTVTGPLPFELVVPRELMPPPGLAGWQVQLDVNDTYGPAFLPEPGGEYDVTVRLAQRFYRTVLPASATSP